MPVSSTAVVSVDGEGRKGGHVRSSDGLLETSLALPEMLGGAGTATNPEQLPAADWAACFLGALRHAATAQELANAAHQTSPY
jgi:osmotically inducible protein OsmC